MGQPAYDILVEHCEEFEQRRQPLLRHPADPADRVTKAPRNLTPPTWSTPHGHNDCHAPRPPLVCCRARRARSARPSGCRSCSARSSVDGGIHPRFGTRNRVLPLTDGQYLEVVEVLDHPASDKAPFGQAVRARSEAGGGWLGWVVSVDDIAPVEERLEREPVQGNRHRPDGVELRWRQLGVKGLQSDPQLPFFVQWESAREQHPSHGRDAAASRWPGSRSPATPTGSSHWLGAPVTQPARRSRRRVGRAERHARHRRGDVRHARRRRPHLTAEPRWPRIAARCDRQPEHLERPGRLRDREPRASTPTA